MDIRRIDDALDVHSLERLVPDEFTEDDVLGKDTLDLHLERYRFAGAHIRGTRVLDCACGVGYGTAMMSEMVGQAVHLVGVDVSPEAIDYARKRYARPGLEFILADGTSWKDARPFDTILTLETIEHVQDYETFVANLVSQLGSDGCIIASVPYTPSMDGNPYHLHDFTIGGYKRLFEQHGLEEHEVLRQVQRFRPVRTILGREGTRDRDIRRNLAVYYLKHPWGLVKRAYATLRYGFTNRYITAVWVRRS
jgi:SAM-dependent methyltransferase